LPSPYFVGEDQGEEAGFTLQINFFTVSLSIPSRGADLDDFYNFF
jgi:hypothetical protein